MDAIFGIDTQRRGGKPRIGAAQMRAAPGAVALSTGVTLQYVEHFKRGSRAAVSSSTRAAVMRRTGRIPRASLRMWLRSSRLCGPDRITMPLFPVLRTRDSWRSGFVQLPLLARAP